MTGAPCPAAQPDERLAAIEAGGLENLTRPQLAWLVEQAKRTPDLARLKTLLDAVVAGREGDALVTILTNQGAKRIGPGGRTLCVTEADFLAFMAGYTGALVRGVRPDAEVSCV